MSRVTYKPYFNNKFRTIHRSIFVSLLFILITLWSCSSKEVIYWCGPGGVADRDMEINITEINYSVKSDSITIRGKILDSLILEPLIGANVIVRDNDLSEIAGVATDIDGKFSLSFRYKPTYKIRFAYIGYKSKLYKLGDFIFKFLE